jgi:hypothetical protein
MEAVIQSMRQLRYYNLIIDLREPKNLIGRMSEGWEH